MASSNKTNPYSQAGNQFAATDLLEMFKALENRIYRKLNVCTLVRVESIDTTAKTCTVTPFPIEEGTESASVNAYYVQGIENQLLVGKIAVMVYADRSFAANYSSLIGGDQTIATTSNNDLHSKQNGIVICVVNPTIEDDSDTSGGS